METPKSRTDYDEMVKLARSLLENRNNPDQHEFAIAVSAMDEFEPLAGMRLDTYCSVRLLIQALLYFHFPCIEMIEKYAAKRQLKSDDVSNLILELRQVFDKQGVGQAWNQQGNQQNLKN